MEKLDQTNTATYEALHKVGATEAQAVVLGIMWDSAEAASS